MRKVIGIGETILDLILKENTPLASMPGGSTLNAIVSLARTGCPTCFLTEIGDDQAGQLILNFLKNTGVSTNHLVINPNFKTPLSLAFLDAKNNATYSFYKGEALEGFKYDCPEINKDDIVLFGSYFAVDPNKRKGVEEFLQYARNKGALLFYDPNFREAHQGEAIKLTPTLLDNFELADVICGSVDDFKVLYGLDDPKQVFQRKIEFYCKNFICTSGDQPVHLHSSKVEKTYPTPAIQTVSTIGAGDNFNAGIIHGFLQLGVTRENLNTLNEEEWDSIINWGQSFSKETCLHLENFVPQEFTPAKKA